jgi:hypothetical protein
MNTAPIALFTYNRPDHTAKTIAALAANELAADSDLFVFSDAPRNAQAVEGVQRVRELVRAIVGFRSVTVIERQENFGLSRSIISGVTDLVARYGRVIVLEDDLVTAPFFLRYMNDALERYAEDDRVVSVHGYIYPVQGELPEAFFLRGADCWGWGTWKRGWDLFEEDGAKLLHEIRKRRLTRDFDFDNSYPYTRMLQRQVRGENDSWAIRWYASAFLEGKLTLYPGRSLVQNIGNDASGTHSGNYDHFHVVLADSPVKLDDMPIEVSGNATKRVADFFRALKPTFWQKQLNSVRKRWNRIVRTNAT